MRIACVQVETKTDESRKQRIARVVEMLSGLRDIDLVVLPELWATGYFQFDHYEEEAESASGELVEALKEVAVSLNSFVHGGSFVERDEENLFNTSVLLDPHGRLVEIYRKVHVFGYQSKEAELIRAGKSPVAVPLPYGCIAGLATCYDVRFPEYFRVLVDRGADLFLIPAAWPAERIEHWRLLIQVRALENQAFVVGCNMTGIQQGIRCGGHSLVVDPWGEVIAEAGEIEQILEVTVDLGVTEAIRNEFPVLSDRRVTDSIAGSATA